MIRSRLDELRLQVARERGQRRLTLQELEAETGIAVSTLSRLSAGKSEAVKFETLNTLCAYFRCGVGDLLEYVADTNAAKAEAN